MVHKLLGKQHRQTTNKQEGLPKRLMLARNKKNENSMYEQYKIQNNPAVTARGNKRESKKGLEFTKTCDEDHKFNSLSIALRHHQRQRHHLIRATVGVLESTIFIS